MCEEICQILGSRSDLSFRCRCHDPWGRSADGLSRATSSLPERVEGPITIELVHCGDRFERAGHDLGRARSLRFVGQPAFEQFGIGEDDAELVVQPVKQPQRPTDRPPSGATGPPC